MNNTDLQNAIQGALDNALTPLAAKLGELLASHSDVAKTAENTQENEIEEARKHFASMKKRLIAKGIMPNTK